MEGLSESPKWAVTVPTPSVTMPRNAGPVTINKTTVHDAEICGHVGAKHPRNRLYFASLKRRKLVAAALRPVYTAVSAETAAAALDEFKRGGWGRRYPTVRASWSRAWGRGKPLPCVPAGGALRGLHDQCDREGAQPPAKIIKTRRHFPTDAVATRLALRNITVGGSRAAIQWREAMNQFAVLCEECLKRYGIAGR